MKLFKKYSLIIAIVLLVVVFLGVRNLKPGSFKYDARKQAERSFNNSNIVTVTETGNIQGDKLIISLDSSGAGPGSETLTSLHIAPDSVLNEKYLYKIKDHKGAVLLYSADQAVSARIWMILSQTGCRNIYILAASKDPEGFKSEFRPDTLGRPEF